MNYNNNQKINICDLVLWEKPYPIEKGIVVCLIDEGKFIDNYDFTYLTNSGGGVMIFFEKMGLVQIMRDDMNINIELIKRLSMRDSKDLLESFISNRDYIL
ncbi:hypothetical protein [Volucribacter amazonae]|uniref:Uncharacterized protein n=1 Tax=Volucribacter amazonae TaxID=256731 RepID=A0A9X4P9W7_9PAST|nr:hypothetical protein [Volucribacter amazonae]MDG6894317.1 hypothetical protein [Volucribacter amazonae]